MMAKRSFEGKRVVLTGASSGIGWYVASELVRAGAYVVAPQGVWISFRRNCVSRLATLESD